MQIDLQCWMYLYLLFNCNSTVHLGRCLTAIILLMSSAMACPINYSLSLSLGRAWLLAVSQRRPLNMTLTNYCKSLLSYIHGLKSLKLIQVKYQSVFWLRKRWGSYCLQGNTSGVTMVLPFTRNSMENRTNNRKMSNLLIHNLSSSKPLSKHA